MSLDQFLLTAHNRVRIRWLGNNALRVTHAPHPKGISPPEKAVKAPFPPDRPWLEHVFLPENPLSLDDPELRVGVLDDCVGLFTRNGREFFREARPPLLGIKNRKPYFSLDLPKTELRFGLRKVDNGVNMALSIQPEEAFYGWGEWFNAFRRQSGNLRLRIRDALAMLQDRETYSAIPIFFSSRGYAFFLLNSHTSRWRIKSETMEIEADGPGADYVVIYGPFFRRIISTYTAMTGRPPLLPRWAFGLWVTSYPQGDQKSVLEHVREHRNHQIPLDAVILDYHWEERFHNFRWRLSLFPDPDGLIAGLKSQGVRLGLIITPFLNRRNRPLQKLLLNTFAHNIPPGLTRDDERALPEFNEAHRQGYLAHDNARWWFGAGGMPDFANPRAASWWNNLMRPLYQQGVEFFKNDDGEYLPENAHSALGEGAANMDGREYHNIYGFYYGRALYEGMQKLEDDQVGEYRRPLIYARSVWAGSQRYPALFLGDQKATFEGIRSTLRAGLNLGMLGFAYWTPDVFGLDGKTTPEIHMRYAQWALLAPVARYFWRPPKIDDTRFPWSHSEEVEANFRKYAELRYRLLPYYNNLAWEAYQTGAPIIRPMVLEFQHSNKLADVYDQVMLGDRLMLCPILEPGAVSRRILLPEGIWHDYWTQETWRGPGEIKYSAPMDRLPVLVRSGTLLPMGQPMDHIPDDHSLDQLELHIWPPYPANGWLFDDDGQTLAYQSGAFSRTRITTQGDPSHITFRIAPAEGVFPGQVKVRHVDLHLQRSTSPTRITINGRPLTEWRYDESRHLTIVPLVCPVQQETIVEVFTSAALTPRSTVF